MTKAYNIAMTAVSSKVLGSTLDVVPSYIHADSVSGIAEENSPPIAAEV